MKRFDLDGNHREFVDRAAALARTSFAARADRYDREAEFPAEDFDDLFRAGLLAAAVPAEHGGLGLGLGDGLFALWMITKELAKSDMSLARCWEGHVNSQVLIAGMGDDRQRGRWFEGIVERGEKWVAWSGEPQSKVPGQPSPFGTHVREESGGYVLNGTKAFATAAPGARWAILLVNLHGPGGARHAAADAAAGLLLLACDLTSPGIRFDRRWWDPIGMRATVSYVAHFEETFLPAENLIGRPGQYLAEGWQACFSPHYGATFLGGAEAAYEYTLDYVRVQDKAHDPYVQHRVASMELGVDSSHLWLRHVADLWRAGRRDEARSAGNRARYLIERWSTEALDHAVRACGARGLIRPSPLERIYRDLSFYVRHDNADHVLATIGREALGRPHDGSFFNEACAPPAPGRPDTQLRGSDPS
jgi:alkylation response protein AidB-like acyl-CoA dehydrogenase